MRIDRVKEEELKKRKGSSIRMIIQLIWLGMSFVIAYFFSSYLFNNTELTLDFLRISFSIPVQIPDWGIHAAFVFVLVLVMQFIFALGYVFGSPEGRKKTGLPRADSRNPDPFDQDRPF